MDQEQVIANLQEVFDSVFMDEVHVTPELSAREVPEWDSIAHISLIVAVEEKFGVRFRVGEVEATKNVGDLSKLILSRIKQG